MTGRRTSIHVTTRPPQRKHNFFPVIYATIEKTAVNRTDRAEILDRRYRDKRNRKGQKGRNKTEEAGRGKCDERRIFHRSVRGGFGNGTRESWTSARLRNSLEQMRLRAGYNDVEINQFIETR